MRHRVTCKLTIDRRPKFNRPSLKELLEEQSFDCIILSPGPGSPIHEKDLGLCLDILKNKMEIPILGVCLGHQALVHVCGATIVKSDKPKHGIVDVIQHYESGKSDGLFEGIPQQFKVVRYHSLVADDESLPEDLVVTARVVLNLGDADVKKDLGEIMGVRHVDKPFWGVQFHPESCCTEYGLVLLQNFLNLTKRFWKAKNNRQMLLSLELDSKHIKTDLLIEDALPTPIASTPLNPTTAVIYMNMMKNNNATPELFMSNQNQPDNWIWLDSAKKEHGRFSYCCNTLHPSTSRFEYCLSKREIREYKSHSESKTIPLLKDDTFYKFVCDFISQRSVSVKTSVYDIKDSTNAVSCVDQLPFDFMGGMVGYFGYEMKAESFCARHQQYNPSFENSLSFPDALFWNVERWIVWDHVEKNIYVMAIQREVDKDVLKREAVEWVECVGNEIQTLVPVSQAKPKKTDDPSFEVLYFPDREEYIDKIKAAQKLIAEGETYQVCLTTPLLMKSKSQNLASTFDYYMKLRQNNAATFGAFMDTPSLSLLCSSPELFLCINRHRSIFMKPIKGTVARPTRSEFNSVEAYKVEDESRSEFLKNDIKNRAENLMIVDLIRNDLNLISEKDSVHVSKLMVVESYATVHQLVTTVEASLKKELDGVDAVVNTFPPGEFLLFCCFFNVSSTHINCNIRFNDGCS